MTLAEKLRNEGEQKGIKGLREAIEAGLAVNFPGDIDNYNKLTLDLSF